MINSPEKQNYHNPNVALAAAGKVTAGLGEMRQKLQGALDETTEAAQRHGQFSESTPLQPRGESLKLEHRIEARDLLNKDALERSGIPAHVGEDALKGAEVIPFHPESEVEQPRKNAA